MRTVRLPSVSGALHTRARVSIRAKVPVTKVGADEQRRARQERGGLAIESGAAIPARRQVGPASEMSQGRWDITF